MKYIIFLACAFAIAEGQTQSGNPLASLTAYASRNAGSTGADASSGSGLSMFSVGMPGPSMPSSLSGMASFGESSSGAPSGLSALSMPGVSGLTRMPGMPGASGMMGRGMLGAMAASGGNFGNIMKMQTYVAILTGRCNSISPVQKLLMLNGQFGDDMTTLYQCTCSMKMPPIMCLQMSRNM